MPATPPSFESLGIGFIHSKRQKSYQNKTLTSLFGLSPAGDSLFLTEKVTPGNQDIPAET